MCIPSDLALSPAAEILDQRSTGKGKISTHSDPPDNRTLVFPSTGKVFAIVAPLNAPYLISMYLQNCGCGVRETRRVAMVVSVQGK